MKVTTRGPVTIPSHIRDVLGLVPGTHVVWETRDGVAVLRKAEGQRMCGGCALVERMRGRTIVKMSTHEIMALMRG